eukprot:gene48832-56676_t
MSPQKEDVTAAARELAAEPVVAAYTGVTPPTTWCVVWAGIGIAFNAPGALRK